MFRALRSSLWQRWAAWRTFHFSEVVYHLRDQQATNRVFLHSVGELEGEATTARASALSRQ